MTRRGPTRVTDRAGPFAVTPTQEFGRLPWLAAFFFRARFLRPRLPIAISFPTSYLRYRLFFHDTDQGQKEVHEVTEEVDAHVVVTGRVGAGGTMKAGGPIGTVG